MVLFKSQHIYKISMKMLKRAIWKLSKTGLHEKALTKTKSENWSQKD